MISQREDYSYLLDELSKISGMYRLYYGKIVDLNGEEFKDETIKDKVEFYILYSYAYQKNDGHWGINEDVFDGDYYQAMILCSYNMFNYLINIFLKEYQVYGDIGTGNISYFPYEKAANYLLGIAEAEENMHSTSEVSKEITINYLNSVFDLKDYKKRVKK